MSTPLPGDAPPLLHTASEFEAQLADLRGLVARMSDSVVEMLDDGLRALDAGDPALADKVVGRDEEIDELEMAIDRLCTQILAIRQPTASDLRYVVGSFKVVTDLERIGDLAGHVGELVGQILRSGDTTSDAIPAEMTATVRDMLFTATRALQAIDPAAAALVPPRDELVDRLYRETMQSLTAAMRARPDRVEECSRWLFLAKHLERVADHATNMAETVIYMARGEDVRHPESQRGSSPSRG